MNFYIGFLIVILILVVAFLIYLAYDTYKHPKEWAEYNAQVKAKHEHQTLTKIVSGVEKVCCPKCGCSDIYTGKRGWRITTGFYGSSKVYNTCKKCGYHWKAGK